MKHQALFSSKDKSKNKVSSAAKFISRFRGLLHCFSTCIEITGNNWCCLNLKNVENCKDKFQRVKKL